jgi:hypothetical protein
LYYYNFLISKDININPNDVASGLKIIFFCVRPHDFDFS